MRLHNTLSGRVEELEPLEPGTVRIYACGVTPYDQSHIGHAAQAIIFDVLVRYLRWSGNPAGGYTVTYVSNYTDVDDKVIERGRKLDRDPLELAAEHIEQWEREQVALNLLVPDVRPRVTEEIETIVALIERIIERGHAYATPEGNVYFRVRSMKDYGKLSHRDVDQLRSGTRNEPVTDKEDVLDFALWKAAPAGENGAVEPKWPAPWGEGRPGWHIECSAMSQRYLGDSFDIHGGGIDLLFPHHENEIAQSEAAGAAFARLWMHNGLVQHDGEKMSKSIGNVVTVEEALRRWGGDAIRLFVLTGHYRSANNVTDEAMAAAEAGVERLRHALRDDPPGTPETVDPTSPTVDRAGMSIIGDPEAPGTVVINKFGLIASGPQRAFTEAMDDDLATPRALAALFKHARAINIVQEFQIPTVEARNMLRKLAEVLGLRLEEAGIAALDAAGLSKIAARFDVTCGDADVGSMVKALLAHREQARADRDFALADDIRTALADAGVEVEDTPDGPRWSVRG